MLHNREFLFTDFHGCKVKVALYQGILRRGSTLCT